jgi:ribonuclease E
MSNRKIFVTGNKPNYKIAVLDKNGNLEEVLFGAINEQSIKFNIYAARVTKVEPSLQAAFVEYENGQSGFLPFSEIHKSNYCISEDDKAKIVDDNKFSSPDIGDDNVEIIGRNNDADESIDIKDIDIFKEDVMKKDKTKSKKYLIQDVIKVDQMILVQAFKDKRGNKGASLTSYLSLLRRYFVFMPNNDKMQGISKKISDSKERKRLRDIISSFQIPEGSSLVIRTAAEGVSENELKADYDAVMIMWKKLQEEFGKTIHPKLLYEAEEVIQQSIRDHYLEGTVVMAEGQDAVSHLKRVMTDMGIDAKSNFIEYKDRDSDMFQKFGISDKINNLYRERVDLQSGGYLIINHTEALVSIDVNSGKLANQHDIEETAFKTNKEAVSEIARQCKLRDIGGLIIVDFIDMENFGNRSEIENQMRYVLSKDKARVQILPISPFGLMEISRQRVKTSFIESVTKKCKSCNGSGRVFASNFVIDELINVLKNKSDDYKTLEVTTSGDIAMTLMGVNRKDVQAIEKEYKTNIVIKLSDSMPPDGFKISGVSKSSTDSLEIYKNDTMYEINLEDGKHINKKPINEMRIAKVNHNSKKPKPSSKKPSSKKNVGLISMLMHGIKDIFAEPKKKPPYNGKRRR